MDEFELIGRCFRDRATRRPGTVLGIGDDAALLDTGGAPLVHAWATVPFSERDDAAGIARRVFGAALVRLAAQAVTPRWTTLGFTCHPDDPGWVESFAATAAAVCGACGVELIGGDTTRGPGRATVFALGTRSALPRGTAPPPPATIVGARLSLAMAHSPEHPVATLISVCADLAARGADIRCEEMPGAGGDLHADTLVLFARTDTAGLDALRAAARHLRPGAHRLEPDG